MRRWLVGLVLVTLALSGCWSQREINNLAMAMAVGIDPADGGGVRVTVQIARPGAGGGAAGGSATGRPGPPTYTVEAEGRSVFEAIRNLVLFSSRRVMWAHNKLVVIGKSMPAEGVNQVIDFFTRNPELRFRTLVALGDPDARSIVGQETGMETIPADSIEQALRYSRLVGETIRVDMLQFARDHLDGSTTPVLPVLRLESHVVANPANKPDTRQVVAQGLALFVHGRLAGLLNPMESRGLALARGEVGRVVVTIPCTPQAQQRRIALELVSVKSRIQPGLSRQGQLTFRISVETRAGISDDACQQDYNDPAVMDRLGQELAGALRRDVLAAVAAARALGTDPFGMGRQVAVKLTPVWARVGQRWPEPLKDAEITVATSARVQGGELTVQPTVPEKGRRFGE